jgi:acyl carrier protein
VLLQQWLLDQLITIAFLPTPLAERCLKLEWPEKTSLRAMLTGGDRLNQYPEKALPFELVNNYGPTENTVVATSGLVKMVKPNGKAPSIGRPIDNTQIYLLNAHLQPVPMAGVGELYVSGKSLARCYINQPALTAERLIPNPFSDSPGARLYRTGDLARYWSTGEIEFLGRLDHQVKVRGFRIELGEIETILGQHPKVREVVVVEREVFNGDKSLVAYLVPREGHSLQASELRNYLRDKLPDYMIPSAYLMLTQMPLTPNGKLDRRALPAPESARQGSADADNAPRTSIEEMVAGIWTSVLDVEQVSVNDNFFELGGHSLLATQVVARVRELFGIELPLRTLFEAPTLAVLAEAIEGASQPGRRLQCPPITAVSRESELPLSYAQQRLWFLEKISPEQAIYNVPLSVRLSGPLDVAALEQTLQQIINRHEVLRTRFVEVKGEPRQQIAAQQEFRIKLVDLSHLPAGEGERAARELAQQEAQRGFDLASGPLLRASVLKLAEQEQIVLLLMHHIISDGWSLGVLLREVQQLYESLVSGSAGVELPELGIQYADYAVWQREMLGSGVWAEQVEYWRRQLAGVKVLELPTDRPRPALQTFRGARQKFELPAHVTQGLKQLCRDEGVTLFMALLAAFQTLLLRHTGQEDIVVGTSIANRSRLETEHLLGCFFNQLALRTDLSGDPTFRELLARVRKVTLEAYACQDVPFEKLLEILQPERNSSHFPIFQVSFVFHHSFPKPLEFTGLTISALELPTTITKFDLSLVMESSARGLSGILDYNIELFNDSTIVRMLEHFQALLADVIQNPERELQRLCLASEEETLRLHGFNDLLMEG